MNFNLDDAAGALAERRAIHFQKLCALRLCSALSCTAPEQSRNGAHIWTRPKIDYLCSCNLNSGMATLVSYKIMKWGKSVEVTWNKFTF